MIVLWIVGLVVLLLVFVFIGIYNALVIGRNRVANGWHQIDVQLKRRIDLIPNLVETVKGYAAHERGVFERVTEARAAAMSAQGRGGQGQQRPDRDPEESLCRCRELSDAQGQ